MPARPAINARGLDKVDRSKYDYPADRVAGYIASVAGVGAVFGYIAWAVAHTVQPKAGYKASEWTVYGAGLAGVAALAWQLSRVAFY